MTKPALTPKQQRFCQEYLIDLNGTAAARRAGYRGSDNAVGVTAFDLLRNPKIQAEVKKLMVARAERNDVSQDTVLQGLMGIAQKSESDAARVSAYGLLGKHLGMFRGDKGAGDVGPVKTIRAVLYENIPADVAKAEKLTGKTLAELKAQGKVS